jgi:hypothetical protein
MWRSTTSPCALAHFGQLRDLHPNSQARCDQQQDLHPNSQVSRIGRIFVFFSAVQVPAGRAPGARAVRVGLAGQASQGRAGGGRQARGGAGRRGSAGWPGKAGLSAGGGS